MKPLRILSLLALGACGQGTDVGNAFKMDIVMSSESSAPASESGVLSSSLRLAGTTASSIAEATINVRGVAIPPQTSCDDPLPAVSAWLVARVNPDPFDFVGVLTGGEDLSLSVSLEKELTTCQLRLVLGPATSGTRSGYSVWFQGSTAGGRSVIFRSTRSHLLALTSSEPFAISETQSALESVLYLGDFLTRVGVGEGDGSSLVIEPDTHPAIFRAFLTKLRLALRGYRYSVDADGRPIRERSQALIQGDDSEDELLEGEVN